MGLSLGQAETFGSDKCLTHKENGHRDAEHPQRCMFFADYIIMLHWQINAAASWIRNKESIHQIPQLLP